MNSRLPPALCSLRTLLATERMYNDLFANVANRAALRATSVFAPLDIPASEHQVLALARETYNQACAGYRELCRLNEKHYANL